MLRITTIFILEKKTEGDDSRVSAQNPTIRKEERISLLFNIEHWAIISFSSGSNSVNLPFE